MTLKWKLSLALSCQVVLFCFCFLFFICFLHYLCWKKNRLFVSNSTAKDICINRKKQFWLDSGYFSPLKSEICSNGSSSGSSNGSSTWAVILWHKLWYWKKTVGFWDFFIATVSDPFSAVSSVMLHGVSQMLQIYTRLTVITCSR